jgi:hypothetical protein
MWQKQKAARVARPCTVDRAGLAYPTQRHETAFALMPCLRAFAFALAIALRYAARMSACFIERESALETEMV